ncbi:MAG: hypothetical protein MUC62_00110 [Candidatus Thermoplasmatota archaeon]|jgi:hypothetical protein|nr:hypothetical protein [Candidatus Thermoplasmatota archaeon]
MVGSKLVKDFERDIIVEEEKGLGLYEVLDNDLDVLYVGAGPLQPMLSQHFPEGNFPIQGARYYRTFSSGSYEDVEIRRKSLIEDYNLILGMPPRYNRSQRT